METVKLKNGTTEAAPLVSVMWMTIQRILEDGDAILLYEAVQVARDSRHVPFGNAGDRLEEIAWLQNGKMHESTRNVLLSCAEGDGFDMTFVSPAAAKEPTS